jgi:hypothetical protein
MGEANQEESNLKFPEGTIVDSKGLSPDLPDLTSKTPFTDGTPSDFMPLSGSKPTQTEGGNVDTKA